MIGKLYSNSKIQKCQKTIRKQESGGMQIKLLKA